MLRPRLASERGATLIELLIGMALSAFVAVVVIQALHQSVWAGQRSSARADTAIDLQVATQRISREIRAANPIVVADAARLDVQIARAGQTRTYRYDLAAMAAPATRNHLREVRTVGATSNTFIIAEEIPTAGLAFTYYDAAGAALTSLPLSAGDRARVRSIQISLTRFTLVDNAPITVVTTVSVRNIP